MALFTGHFPADLVALDIRRRVDGVLVKCAVVASSRDVVARALRDAGCIRHP